MVYEAHLELEDSERLSHVQPAAALISGIQTVAASYGVDVRLYRGLQPCTIPMHLVNGRKGELFRVVVKGDREREAGEKFIRVFCNRSGLEEVVRT